jgi:3-hydroxyacyl-CoA dehydrogenase
MMCTSALLQSPETYEATDRERESGLLRQVGMHFMNPVPVMPLVELIRGIATTDEACNTPSAHLGPICCRAKRDRTFV